MQALNQCVYRFSFVSILTGRSRAGSDRQGCVLFTYSVSRFLILFVAEPSRTEILTPDPYCVHPCPRNPYITRVEGNSKPKSKTHEQNPRAKPTSKTHDPTQLSLSSLSALFHVHRSLKSVNFTVLFLIVCISNHESTRLHS